MRTWIQLGDIAVDVVRKDIRNVHLSVHPPVGRVRIAAPDRMSLDNVRVFAISKLPWIRQQQQKLCKQERETPREYLDRESHFLWGKRYLLKVIEKDAPSEVQLIHSTILLQIRHTGGNKRKQAILDGWYREKLKEAVLPLIKRWERLICVKVEKLFVQKMKTKWGSCNPHAKSIRLNTELAKKPAECLEYIVAHEVVHLVERHHNERFNALMDRYLPSWRFHRDELNRAPLSHQTWRY